LINPRELYDGLMAGTKNPADVEISELFELADRIAIVDGNFTAKQQIFEWIHQRPRLTNDDCFRVGVFVFDLKRRQGDAEDAYDNLLGIEVEMPLRSVLARAEWLQAVGQCLLVLRRFNEAVDAQRKIVEEMDDSISVRRQLYYLETFIALKQHARQFDDELNDYFAIYRQLLAKTTELGEAERARALSGLAFLEGQYHVAQLDWRKAASSFDEEFGLGPADRQKAVGSLMYLYVRLCQLAREFWVSPRVAFLQQHLGDLQPTDIQILQKEYDTVVQAFGINPPETKQ